jgi:uncharacterized membrane protein
MSWSRRFRVRSHLQSSLWPVPCIFGFCGMLLGMAVWRFDRWMGWSLFSFEHQGATALIAAVVGATLTFLGTAFSVLLVVVQFASTQLTPRAIRVSVNDPLYRVTVGLFAATFVFALIILGRTTSTFVPQFSVFIASMLAVLSLAAYVLLISHLRLSLRPVIVASRVGALGRKTLSSIYTRALGTTPPAPVDGTPSPRPPTRVITNEGPPGILIAFNVAGLVAEAQRCDGALTLVPAPGDFVHDGAPIFQVFEPAQPMRDAVLLDSVVLGQERTMDQDPAFAFRILVDVAIKALSAAINDPTSAVMAIDQLHSLLFLLASRRLDEGSFRDGAGRVRLTVDLPTWEDYVCLAVDEIRHCGQGQVQIARRLKAMLDDLAQIIPADRRAVIERELKLLAQTVERGFADRDDQQSASEADSQGIGSSPKTR